MIKQNISQDTGPNKVNLSGSRQEFDGARSGVAILAAQLAIDQMLGRRSSTIELDDVNSTLGTLPAHNPKAAPDELLEVQLASRQADVVDAGLHIAGLIDAQLEAFRDFQANPVTITQQ